MFDRKTYMKKYYGNQYQQRKAEGRCTACGEKLTLECKTLLCEYCRKKAKYSRVAKVNISKMIAEAKADTVKKIIERLSDEYEFEWHADVDTRELSRSDLIEWVTDIAAELLEKGVICE